MNTIKHLKMCIGNSFFKNNIQAIKLTLKLLKKKMYGDIIKKKGIGTFLYQLLWDFLFHLGKYK